jgi:hypothetical protein
MRGEALLVCLLLFGCERKAPGPRECVAFATFVLSARAPQAAHDGLVRDCLVTPYDYDLFSCVDRTRSLRSCRARLELRRRRLE